MAIFRRSTVLLGLGLLLTLSLPVAAEGASESFQIRAAEITAYGLFTLADHQTRAGFRSKALPADSVTGVKFTDFTNTITAELGTNFGFRYRINSSPKGRSIRLRYVIHFPEGGLVTPGGKVYETSDEVLDIRLGEENYYGYGFDEPWEMVPGEWAFEVWHQRARLIRKTFTVQMPVTSADPSLPAEPSP